MWALSLDRLDLYASQREDNKTTRMRRRPPLLVLLLFLGAALLWWCSLSLTTLSPDRSHSPSHLAVAEGALPLESKEALSAPVQPRAEVSVPVQLAPIGGEGGFWLPPSETGGAAASAHNAGAGQVHEVCISRPGRAEEQRALSLLPRPSSASCTATAPQSASPKSSARGGASEGSAAGFACAVAASASEVIILAAGAGTRSEALRKRLLAARDVLSGPPSQPRAPKRVLLITGDVDVEALATSLGIAWIADAALTGVVRTIGGGGGGGGGGGDGGDGGGRNGGGELDGGGDGGGDDDAGVHASPALQSADSVGRGQVKRFVFALGGLSCSLTRAHPCDGASFPSSVGSVPLSRFPWRKNQ